MHSPATYPRRGGHTSPAAELNDETLRDGVQSPSVRHPCLEEKRRALHLMERLGVNAVSLGLPGASPAQRRDVEVLFREVISARLDLDPHCAGRTCVEDLEPVADIIQAVGRPLTAYAFLGTSPIRRYAEGWTLDQLQARMEAALSFAERQGIPVAFVTEDTLRSRPEDLERLFGQAIDQGVRRLVLCDTVGHASPSGAQRLVRFARRLVQQRGEPVALDWHGHDDRGLAVANSLAAEAAGVDRIHGTMLGVGERCGNAALDQLLINHAASGRRQIDKEALDAYRDLVCDAFEWHVAPSYPWRVPTAARSLESV